MKKTVFTFTKPRLIALLLLLPLLLCACHAAPPQSEDDWFFSLKFQEMTRKELVQTLLGRGWVRYKTEFAADGEGCYVGTLFGTKTSIFCAGEDPETGLLTGLYLYSFQFTPDFKDLLQERLAAVEDGMYNDLRAAQFWEGSASEAAAAWATSVRESLARTGAVLSENGANTLPGGANTSQKELQKELLDVLELHPIITAGFLSAGPNEGVYRFPDGRLTMLYLSALPREEDGPAGRLQFCLFLCTEDYRTIEGAVPALPGV